MARTRKLTQDDIAAALTWAGREYSLLMPKESQPDAVMGRAEFAHMGRLAIDVRRVLKGLHAVDAHERSRDLKRAIAAGMAIHSLPRSIEAARLIDRVDTLFSELEHLVAACDELAKVSKLKLGTGMVLLIRALVIGLHERTGRWPTLTEVRACLDAAALQNGRYHPHFTQAQAAESAVKTAFNAVKKEIEAAKQ